MACVRLHNDPNRYICRRKGRYQARPWCDGERYDLGLFPTPGEARKAILDFWWGRRQPLPRFVRAIRTQAGVWFLVVLTVRGERHRLRHPDHPHGFPDRDTAAAAVEAFLTERLGSEQARRAMRRA